MQPEYIGGHLHVPAYARPYQAGYAVERPPVCSNLRVPDSFTDMVKFLERVAVAETRPSASRNDAFHFLNSGSNIKLKLTGVIGCGHAGRLFDKMFELNLFGSGGKEFYNKLKGVSILICELLGELLQHWDADLKCVQDGRKTRFDPIEGYKETDFCPLQAIYRIFSTEGGVKYAKFRHEFIADSDKYKDDKKKKADEQKFKHPQTFEDYDVVKEMDETARSVRDSEVDNNKSRASENPGKTKVVDERRALPVLGPLGYYHYLQHRELAERMDPLLDSNFCGVLPPELKEKFQSDVLSLEVEGVTAASFVRQHRFDKKLRRAGREFAECFMSMFAMDGSFFVSNLKFRNAMFILSYQPPYQGAPSLEMAQCIDFWFTRLLHTLLKVADSRLEDKFRVTDIVTPVEYAQRRKFLSGSLRPRLDKLTVGLNSHVATMISEKVVSFLIHRFGAFNVGNLSTKSRDFVQQRENYHSSDIQAIISVYHENQHEGSKKRPAPDSTALVISDDYECDPTLDTVIVGGSCAEKTHSINDARLIARVVVTDAPPHGFSFPLALTENPSTSRAMVLRDDIEPEPSTSREMVLRDDIDSPTCSEMLSTLDDDEVAFYGAWGKICWMSRSMRKDVNWIIMQVESMEAKVKASIRECGILIELNKQFDKIYQNKVADRLADKLANRVPVEERNMSVDCENKRLFMHAADELRRFLVAEVKANENEQTQTTPLIHWTRTHFCFGKDLGKMVKAHLGNTQSQCTAIHSGLCKCLKEFRNINELLGCYRNDASMASTNQHAPATFYNFVDELSAYVTAVTTTNRLQPQKPWDSARFEKLEAYNLYKFAATRIQTYRSNRDEWNEKVLGTPNKAFTLCASWAGLDVAKGYVFLQSALSHVKTGISHIFAMLTTCEVNDALLITPDKKQHDDFCKGDTELCSNYLMSVCTDPNARHIAVSRFLEIGGIKEYAHKGAQNWATLCALIQISFEALKFARSHVFDRNTTVISRGQTTVVFRDDDAFLHRLEDNRPRAKAMVTEFMDKASNTFPMRADWQFSDIVSPETFTLFALTMPSMIKEEGFINLPGCKLRTSEDNYLFKVSDAKLINPDEPQFFNFFFYDRIFGRAVDADAMTDL